MKKAAGFDWCREKSMKINSFYPLIVIAAAILLGLLPALSGAQPAEESLLSESGDAGINQPPQLLGLAPDPPGSAEAGAAVRWTARARDEDDSIIYFLFRLKGPSTARDWRIVRGWSEEDNWTWQTTEMDAGGNAIQVWVRDDQHAGPDAFDAELSETYRITGAPPAVQPPIMGGEEKEGPTLPEGTGGTPEQPAPKINQPPRVTDLFADPPSPQLAGTAITWTATATDPEGDAILYQFLVNGSDMTGWTEKESWTWTPSESEAGSSQVEVRIRDGQHAGPEGYDDSKSALYTITAPPAEVPPTALPLIPAPETNEKPALVSLTADPASPQPAGTAIAWTATATDPEGDTISYQFLVNGSDRTGWTEKESWTWTPSDSEAGTSQVEVRIRDGQHAGPDGYDDSKSSMYTVTAPPAALPQIPAVQTNEKPILVSLTAEPESPQAAGTAITWTATANDTEGDTILYQFLVNGSDRTGWTEKGAWTWTPADSEAGTSEVEVLIRDGKHAGPEGYDDSKSAMYTVTALPAEVPPTALPQLPAPETNDKPALVSLTADPASPQPAGTAIEWTALAADPDGDAILYQFLVNGSDMTGWTEKESWTWTPAESEAGTSRIEVRARDDQHGPDDYDNKTAEYTVLVSAPAELPPVEEALPSPAENLTPVQENLTPPLPQIPLPSENITEPLPSENITGPLPAENITGPIPAEEINQKPAVQSLTPSKLSPQLAGEAIVWTANATDNEKDKILYRFFLSGPSTGDTWQAKTDWSEEISWNENTSAEDAGQNQIRVWVRDGKHADENSFDSEQVAFFTILLPTGNVSGKAFDDRNSNLMSDSGESGLAGWTIQLSKDGQEVSTLTGDDGSYRFDNLAPGSYILQEVPKPGWTLTAPKEGSYSIEMKGQDEAGKDFGNKLTAFSIAGRKFNDLNGNGADDGEPGLAGWTIQLSQNGQLASSQKTEADGSYKFDNLTPGSYTVAEVQQPGWARTMPKGESYSVELKEDDEAGKDFGNRGSWSISGIKFHDLNGNGLREADEPGLVGWTIQLATGGQVVNATSTGEDGSYIFSDLAPGSYSLSEVAKDGWVQTAPRGSYDLELKDSDIAGKDFGNKGNISISGRKYFDINSNHLQDSGEPGIPSSPVSLMEAEAVIAQATTDQDGSYTFSGLLPGTYTIKDPLPEGLSLTTSPTITVTVTTSVVVDADFGIAGPHSISGMKYEDLNGDGTRNSATEQGKEGWEVVLTGSTWFGAPIPPTTKATDANGAYEFSGLIPGTYKVSEVSRTGWTQTSPPGGSYTVTFAFAEPPRAEKNKDFGNKPPAQSISGVKYNDYNGNGQRDPGEPGLKDWTVNLEQPAGTIIKTATTASDGSYIFAGLAPGDYRVGEVNKTGWTETAPAGGKYLVTLGPGGAATGKDFGNYNAPPKDAKLKPNKDSPQRVGTTIAWKASAKDPEGDQLLFKFLLSGPSTGGHWKVVRDWQTKSTWTWSTASYPPGTYQLEVWIRDGKHAGPEGYDVKASAPYRLTSPDLPPVVDVLFSDRPSPTFAGSWIGWTALAHDPEISPLEYRFFLRGTSTGGLWIDQTGWSRSNRWVWRTTFIDVGYSEVLVAVRDGRHAGPSGADDYSVAGFWIKEVNQPPVITAFSSVPSSPRQVGANVKWTARAFDPEERMLFFRYWLKGPSTGGIWKPVRDWSTDPSWNWATSPRDVGTSQAQVQVRDGFHEGPFGWDDDAGALFTIQAPNQPPQLQSLILSPTSPQNAGTPVRVTAMAFDPDGDRLIYRFWLRGPSTGNSWKVVQDWSYSSSWLWTSSSADAGVYTVYVYVRDGRHQGPEGFDSSLGSYYVLANPLVTRKVTSAADGDMPSLLSTGDGYLLAYQSWELGRSNQGDVVLQKFDLNWNMQKNVWVARSRAYEDSPTLVSSKGYYYVAYVSSEPGNKEIFVKKYDPSLNLVESKQLTSSPAVQDSPSLLALGDNFYLAYQSWDTGPDWGGDIALTKFDAGWRPLLTVQTTKLQSAQGQPSLAFAGGSFFLAYVSGETGNKEIFQKKYDGSLRLTETRRLTLESSDQDYPSLRWLNGQFILLYCTKKGGNYDIRMERFLRDWTPVESAVVVAAPGEQTASSLVYGADGLYWLAYSSQDASGRNIYVKPLRLTSPLKDCQIAASLSSARANSPYTLKLQFYNNYGELADPTDLSLGWSPEDAASKSDSLQRISLGTFQLKSVFGAAGEKSFRVAAVIDGCLSIRQLTARVT